MQISRRGFLVGAATIGGVGGSTATAAHAATGPAAPGARSRRSSAGTWNSALVRVNARGGLVYPRRDGHRLPDFGHTGYHRGGRDIPDVPVVHSIAPLPEGADNHDHIEAAIAVVGALPVGEDGFRGALLLEAGVYVVSRTIDQPYSGVVIRGVGDGADPATNTIIRPQGGDPERNAIVIGDNGNWDGEVPGTRTDLVSDLVRVADAAFTVADASGLSVGDNIIITHPCTQEWIDAVDGGGTGIDAPWTPGQLPIVYNRYVTAIIGNRVSVDVPLFTTLDRSLSQSYVYVWDQARRVTEVGIEDLRVDVAYDGPTTQNGSHAKHAIRIRQAEDAWVRRCTVLHFSQSGIVTGTTTRATVVACHALDPVSEITGSMRYNFNLERNSQQVLFTDCHATESRHAFVSNGTSSVSGVVFHRTTATGSHTSSEGHRQWTQGLLFDNHTELEPNSERTIGLYNRGDWGTGHGWSAVHSVAWNTDTAGTQLVVQRPPTGQNYAIGCFGEVTGDGPYPHPEGWIEGTDRGALNPESLYEAQLADRLR